MSGVHRQDERLREQCRNARDLVLEDFRMHTSNCWTPLLPLSPSPLQVENAGHAGCRLHPGPDRDLTGSKGHQPDLLHGGQPGLPHQGGHSIGKVTGRAASMLGIKPMILFKDGESSPAAWPVAARKALRRWIPADELSGSPAACPGRLPHHGGRYDLRHKRGSDLWMQTRAALRAKCPGALM